MPLYTSLIPDNSSAIVFEQHITGAPLTIALRPLSLRNDWPFINKWLHRELARELSPGGYLPNKHLRETFSIMLQCDFAQPFVGIINDQPGFLIEICDGDKRCDGLDEALHVFEPGDHVIRLVLSPAVCNILPLGVHALTSSLAYFFSYAQVKRIVWEVHRKEKHHLQLAKQAGFTTNESKQLTDVHVYLYSRDNFDRFLLRRQHQTQKLQ